MYKYTTSPKYIQRLDYDYAEFYSLQRGAEFEERISAPKKEFFNLLKQKGKGIGFSKEMQARYDELEPIVGTIQYVINSSGQFHFSATKTHTFRCQDSVMVRLKEILLTPAQHIPRWMCAPVFRDAVVFYDAKGSIVSTLNICFSCERMEIKPFHWVQADEKTYRLARQLLIELGHEVEEPGAPPPRF